MLPARGKSRGKEGVAVVGGTEEPREKYGRWKGRLRKKGKDTAIGGTLMTHSKQVGEKGGGAPRFTRGGVVGREEGDCVVKRSERGRGKDLKTIKRMVSGSGGSSSPCAKELHVVVVIGGQGWGLQGELKRA